MNPPRDDRLAPVRVLVPYIRTFYGGVRRVLEAGLPGLARDPRLVLTYAELCRNDADMDALERSGVGVDRRLGVPGRSVLSGRRGRLAGIAREAPRLAHIAWNVGRHLDEHDVCWVHGHRELLLVLAARAGRSIPIVWHWHGPPLSLSTEGEGAPAERRFTQLLARRCARVVAVSLFCAEQAVRLGVPADRLVLVENAVRLEDAPPREHPPLPPRVDGQVTLLVPCASIRAHKGVHVAVQALRHLSPRHVLWITGDRDDPVAAGYVAELRALAARDGAAGRVHFLGARGDVHRVMAEADVVVVPSIWREPFGLVAAEAQLVGTPLVVADRGALPEIADGGRAGLVVRAEDPAALAAAVGRLDEDRVLRAGLVDVARRRAAERYGYERWRGQIAALLAEVAGRVAPARVLRPAEVSPARPPLRREAGLRGIR
ncbi:MAG TPA: glycosyltransferase family 4 protein [Anaeromyxobacter sp.]|nr:glycosyltransferase family 4 protein [Anaeromyxobacter sp.]